MRRNDTAPLKKVRGDRAAKYRATVGSRSPVRRRLTLGTAWLACLLMASTVLDTSRAVADHPPFHDYEALRRVVDRWASMGVEVEVPARSEEGRDIHLVRVGRGPFTILYLNVLHANEPSGTEAFIRFVWSLLGRQSPSFQDQVLPGVRPEAPLFRALATPRIREALLNRVTILGFPMLDPDGVEAGHQRDFTTNSDYATRLTSASAAIEYAVRTYHPDLMLDSHGGPDRPHLNIGLVEPLPVEEAVLRESRRAAGVAWRAATAIGAKVAYFEEHAFEILTGQHEDPFASADEVYWNTLSKVTPVTQEWYQIEGVPMIYTETVGLQSQDPVISISEGASVQQITMAGLALEASGLLTGERPRKVVAEPSPEGTEVDLPRGARRFLAAVRWEGPGDYELRLEDHRGHTVSAAASDAGRPASLASRSRALSVRRLRPGTYRLVAEPVAPGIGAAVLRATWRVAAPGPKVESGILDRNAQVRLCLEGESVYGRLVSEVDPRLRSPRCRSG